MGCGGSRLGSKTCTVLPPKLRPLFLLRLEEFKTRRSTPPLIKTPSSKFVVHVRDDSSASQSYATPLSHQDDGVFGQTYEESHENTKLEEGFQKEGSRDEAEFEDALEDVYNDDEEDEDEDGDGRMIGNGGESPTFRYYFKDDGNDLDELKSSGIKNTISSDDDMVSIVSSKELSDESIKGRRGRKRSLKKVLPKKLFCAKS